MTWFRPILAGAQMCHAQILPRYFIIFVFGRWTAVGWRYVHFKVSIKTRVSIPFLMSELITPNVTWIQFMQKILSVWWVLHWPTGKGIVIVLHTIGNHIVLWCVRNMKFKMPSCVIFSRIAAKGNWSFSKARYVVDIFSTSDNDFSWPILYSHLFVHILIYHARKVFESIVTLLVVWMCWMLSASTKKCAWTLGRVWLTTNKKTDSKI